MGKDKYQYMYFRGKINVEKLDFHPSAEVMPFYVILFDGFMIMTLTN